LFEEFGDLVNGDEGLKEKINEILARINKSIPKSMQNCLISGTKRALIEEEFLATSLDDDEIMGDNRAIEYVRQELLQLGSRLIRKFAVQLSDAIKEILGDIEDGSTKESRAT